MDENDEKKLGVHSSTKHSTGQKKGLADILISSPELLIEEDEYHQKNLDYAGYQFEDIKSSFAACSAIYKKPPPSSKTPKASRRVEK